MKVVLDRVDKAYHFKGKGNSDVAVDIDNDPNGASPMELLLMSVGSCNAMDIVSILEKQRQEIRSYKIEVEGHRKEVRQAKPFKSIFVRIFLEGAIDKGKAIRAARLSFDKYCSASMTLQNSVDITYGIVLNGEAIGS